MREREGGGEGVHALVLGSSCEKVPDLARPPPQNESSYVTLRHVRQLTLRAVGAHCNDAIRCFHETRKAAQTQNTPAFQNWKPELAAIGFR